MCKCIFASSTSTVHTRCCLQHCMKCIPGRQFALEERVMQNCTPSVLGHFWAREEAAVRTRQGEKVTTPESSRSVGAHSASSSTTMDGREARARRYDLLSFPPIAGFMAVELLIPTWSIEGRELTTDEVRAAGSSPGAGHGSIYAWRR